MVGTVILIEAFYLGFGRTVTEFGCASPQRIVPTPALGLQGRQCRHAAPLIAGGMKQIVDALGELPADAVHPREFFHAGAHHLLQAAELA